MQNLKHRHKRNLKLRTGSFYGARQSDLVYFQTHGRRTREDVAKLTKKRTTAKHKTLTAAAAAL